MVTIGIPPISKPASASLPEGISGAIALAIASKSTGSASKRYLSKYVPLTLPEELEIPESLDVILMRRARSSIRRVLSMANLEVV